MKKLLCFILSIMVVTSTFAGFNIVANAEDEEVDYAALYPYDSTSKCYYEICDNGTQNYTSDDYAKIVKYKGTSYSYTTPTTLGNYVVKEIGREAFANNTDLDNLTLSAPITKIDAATFRGCTDLDTFAVAEDNDGGFSVSSGVLYQGAYEKLVAFPMQKSSTFTILASVKEIGENAFYGNTKLTSISFKSGSVLTKIGKNAFYGCTALKKMGGTDGKVIIPSTITTIDEGAFEGCSAITSLTIPTSIKTISNRAFANCSSLPSLTIPSSVTTLGDSAFEGCTSLPSVSIPSTVTSVGSNAFAFCEVLVTANVPASVDYVSDGLFDGCSSLTSITIPSNIKTIGARAFADCASITKVSIPNTVTEVGDSAFEGCSLVTSITIGTGVTFIGAGAFAYCSSAIDPTETSTRIKITIPANVKSIGDYAFEGCTLITSITLNDGLESIGSSAFAYCDLLTSINIPKTVTYIGTAICDLCNSLNTITVASDNPNYVATSNILYDKDKTKLIYYPLNITSTSFTVPSTVKTIGASSFANNPHIKKVTISSSVTVIEPNAFNTCESLETITIPSSVEKIGVDAFTNTYWYIQKEKTLNDSGGGAMYIGTILYTYVGDSYPTSISVKSGTTRIEDGALANMCIYNENDGTYSGLEKVTMVDSVTSIGDDAFSGCEALTTLTMGSGVTEIGNNAFTNCKKIKTLSLPSKLKTIGDNAFMGCSSITSITIPASVTSMGEGVLRDCLGLTSISVNSSNTAYCSSDGVLYDKAMKTLIQYPLGSSSTSYEIPKGVTQLTPGSFTGVAKLTDITIPSTVVEFGTVEYTDPDGTVITKPDTFLDEANIITIHAYVETPAHAYALENALKFVALPLTGEIVVEDGNVRYLYANDKYAYGWIEDGSNKYYFGYDTYALRGYALVETVGYNFDSTTGVMIEECGDLGDCNFDGSLSIKDVTQLQKLTANIVAKNEKNTLLGDVDGDGRITVRDATNMQLYLAKKIAKFPAVK